ncbi:MAG: phenylacetate-CoA oxygenase subunit PaaC [Candidatus Symbiobacter sp.]|nr:phenylacetate-CoA oxygenase subunit PaaC [Candidatus Symbiobacter sp.]
MTDRNLPLILGDTTLILAQRLAAWCGKGPTLEEDMATTNTALDLLGQARLWLSLAAERAGKGQSEDDLAFHRDADEFRNFLLVEQPNGTYADTITRQYLFDAWHVLYLDMISKHEDAARAEIAAKAVKEVRYHRRRSRDLFVRLGDGTPYSHQLMQAALDNLWPFSGELFSLDAASKALHPLWLDNVAADCRDASLAMPPAQAWMQSGGITGRHSEHLGYILAEMQVLPRNFVGAKW